MRTVKIFGPPGTGKTTRCLQILEEELAGGTALNRIMYCTFSKAGATEAKQRAVDILSSANPDDFRYFKTIHAICFSELSLGKNHVVQPKDLLAFGRSVAIPFSEDYTDDLNIDGLPFGWASSKGSSILNIRQVAAARMVDHHKVEIPHSLTWPMVDDVLASYAKFKQDRALFDYVDFLQMYLKSGEPLPVDVVIVDEAQDLSRLQWEVVHRMAAGAKRMYLAGDDDQSIYGFMGADPYGFLEHPCDEVVVLNQSHRLPAKVLERANKVISRVRRRHPKEVAPVNDGGRMLFWNKSVTDILLTMAKAGRLENVMVIAAMNAILKRLKRDLDHHGIPSSLKGRPITQTDEAQVFYWYYKARQGTPVPARAAAKMLKAAGFIDEAKECMAAARMDPDAVIHREALERDGLDFSRKPVDYFGKDAMSKAIYENLRSIARQANDIEAVIAKPQVELTTYHNSKGREARTVILVPDCSPSAQRYFERNMDYERRLTYVGMTRAKETVLVARQSSPTVIKELLYA